jgi:hypothetical protein
MVLWAGDEELIIITLTQHKIIGVLSHLGGRLAQVLAHREPLSIEQCTDLAPLANMAEVPQEAVTRIDHGGGTPGLGYGLSLTGTMLGSVIGLHQGILAKVTPFVGAEEAL